MIATVKLPLLLLLLFLLCDIGYPDPSDHLIQCRRWGYRVPGTSTRWWVSRCCPRP